MAVISDQGVSIDGSTVLTWETIGSWSPALRSNLSRTSCNDPRESGDHES